MSARPQADRRHPRTVCRPYPRPCTPAVGPNFSSCPRTVRGTHPRPSTPAVGPSFPAALPPVISSTKSSMATSRQPSSTSACAWLSSPPGVVGTKSAQQQQQRTGVVCRPHNRCAVAARQTAPFPPPLPRPAPSTAALAHRAVHLEVLQAPLCQPAPQRGKARAQRRRRAALVVRRRAASACRAQHASHAGQQVLQGLHQAHALALQAQAGPLAVCRLFQGWAGHIQPAG